MGCRLLLVGLVCLLLATPLWAQTQVYFGDTHLHTSFSPDAYFFGNRTADPDTAYRYAKGYPVVHPYHKARIRINTPLDFLVVADHAEMMGVPARLFAGDEVLSESESGQRYIRMMNEGAGEDVFREFVSAINQGTPIADLDAPDVRRSVWAESVAMADRHNEPGKFTSFIGWEWTSTPNGRNLHRVVFMPQDGEVARQFVPYSAFDSDRPEDLWDWLEETSQRTGASFLAIPHNSNISGGLMFNETDSDGRPITAEYARRRMSWEPVVEITQIKGDSEAHPILSATDEFAGFAPFNHAIDAEQLGQQDDAAAEASADPGDYVRSGLRRGLEIEARVGTNPFKFGVIGSTDSHTGMSSAEENNFHGKTAFDSTPENTFGEYLGIKGFGADMSAAGLAAVWAEENTRDALFAALARKEVYATTGPRIVLRLFGGWDFAEDDAASVELASRGYERGVPMGGDLTRGPEGQPPTLLFHAAMAPQGARLDRVQIVKGWLDANGDSQERIYDVAWSGNRELDDNGKLPAIANTVDPATGRFDNTSGAVQLSGAWTDPDFDPRQRCFYYVRVLQIPTPRHTLYNAIALEMEHPSNHPFAIQERAYSSPIWYTP